jgi:DNA invertase Pin-like site-specific DNA recombinase
MATGQFVAYYRVSTQKQGKSGLGLEAQREAVRNYLNGGDWSLIGEFTEVESGKRNDRPQLAAAQALARKNKAMLVIAKLDRLGRNLAFIATLMESGVPFVAADRPHAKPFELHIYAAMAEEEARQISARTKAALAAAKARGVRLGTPANLEHSKGNETRKAAAAARAADLAPIVAEIQAGGAMSLREIAGALNDRGIPTTKGGRWSATQVMRLLSR